MRAWVQCRLQGSAVSNSYVPSLRHCAAVCFKRNHVRLTEITNGSENGIMLEISHHVIALDRCGKTNVLSGMKQVRW